MTGLLLINKPTGITSFDVIRQLRPITGERKIGHAGTLDPLASGLMLMLLGSATKQAQTLTKLDKTYVAEITLGYTSSTGDAEGEKELISDTVPTRAEVTAVLECLTGEISQTPPIYSAIKVAGQEAYKRARRGETVEMPSRKVTIHHLKLIKYEYPVVTLEAAVSSGTYIRTMAEDIGRLLGTGGYLTDLVRTQIGQYDLDQALELSGITATQISAALRSTTA